jgi:hypothetical protein
MLSGSAISIHDDSFASQCTQALRVSDRDNDKISPAPSTFVAFVVDDE